jgi:succinylglutamate desuccinylase
MSKPFIPFQGFLEYTLEVDQPPPSKYEVKTGSLEVIGRGALLLQPSHKTMKNGLVISAGVHGNETAPIELLDLLVDDLVHERIAIARPALLLLGHPLAMQKQSRFIEFNMNRLFRGTHQSPPYAGSHDAKRAKELEDYVDEFATRFEIEMHLDLHAAIRDSKIERFALKPFVANKTIEANNSIDSLSRETLDAFGMEALVYQHKEASTFSSHTACNYGATSFTFELGKVKPFGENDLSQYSNVLDALRAFLSDRPMKSQGAELKQFKVCHEILIPDESFVLNVDDNLANFTAFPKGHCIWSSDEEKYVVQANEERLIFPNAHVPIGQRAGLMIVEI